jgi:hypothetical protein
MGALLAACSVLGPRCSDWENGIVFEYGTTISGEPGYSRFYMYME